MFALSLALAALQLPAVESASRPPAWERAFVAQLDSLADLRKAVADTAYLDRDGCYFGEPPKPVSLEATREQVERVALPRLVELARADANSALRDAASAAIAKIRAPERATDSHAPLLDAGWLHTDNWLEQLEFAFERPRSSPGVLRALDAAGQLASDDSLRCAFARRLAQDRDGARKWPRAHLLAAGAVARAWTSAADASLERDLFSALDADDDCAQIASVCLGVFAGRAPEVESLAHSARAALCARFDHRTPTRRHAAWIGAAFLGRRLARADRADERLNAELRARLDFANEHADISAAALALGVLADRSAIAPIAERMRAASPGSRGAMAMALGLLGALSVQEEVATVARRPGSAAERLDAALSLVLIGDKNELNEWMSKVWEGGAQSARELAPGLAAFGDVRALGFLVDELERRRNDPETQLALLQALGAVCDPNATDRRLSSYYSGR